MERVRACRRVVASPADAWQSAGFTAGSSSACHGGRERRLSPRRSFPDLSRTRRIARPHRGTSSITFPSRQVSFSFERGDRSLARTRLQPYPARARATRYDGSTKRELCQGGRHGPAACCADAPAAPHAATADAAQAARWWGLPAKRPAAAQGHTPEDDGEFVGPFAALLLRALLLLASHMRPLSSCLAPVCSEL
jgi:hypothetical protein